MVNYFSKIFKGAWSLLKGMGITLKYYFRKPVTVQYPYERREIAPVWRGTLRQLCDEKGEEICDGCQICARTCPVQCITMEVYKDPADNKRKTSSYTVDFGRCMYCGLCVESCPKKCLIHTTDYEFVSYDRAGMVLGKDKLVKK
ncbi:MAG: NADH-quinone oxidoreductase subunit I [Candidatus Firestonebacteria bacterium]